MDIEENQFQLKYFRDIVCLTMFKLLYSSGELPSAGTMQPWLLTFVNILILQERVDRSFETLFETGVDEMSWDDTVSSVTRKIENFQ